MCRQGRVTSLLRSEMKQNVTTLSLWFCEGNDVSRRGWPVFCGGRLGVFLQRLAEEGRAQVEVGSHSFVVDLAPVNQFCHLSKAAGFFDRNVEIGRLLDSPALDRYLLEK